MLKSKKVKKNNGLNHTAIDRLKTAASLEQNDLFKFLQSSAEGLADEEVERRQQEFGLNYINKEKPIPWYRQLFDAFINPFVGILGVIAIVSFLVDVVFAPPGEKDYKTIIVISAMVLTSVVLRFFQEYRSTLAAEKLKNIVKNTASVVRFGKGKQEINFEEIVPGDLFHLSAGDMIPCDARIISSKDLFINQSILTGETMPVEKTHNPIANSLNYSPLELGNICLAGTNVVSGTALALAVNECLLEFTFHFPQSLRIFIWSLSHRFTFFSSSLCYYAIQF